METKEEKVQRIYSKTKIDRFYNRLVIGKGSFLVRFGSECNELIFDNVHNIFATKNKNFPPEFICLFNMVQTDVKKFIKENGDEYMSSISSSTSSIRRFFLLKSRKRFLYIPFVFSGTTLSSSSSSSP